MSVRFVGLLLLFTVFIECPASCAAEEAVAWKAHPPEYYAAIRKEVKERIASQFEKADLRGMGWYADVRETSKTIEVERDTWTLVFDKRTAGVKRAVVRGRKLDKGLALADVVATDSSGKKFFRSSATDGTLRVREDKLHVYLDGEFTPRSKDGKAFPVRFGIKYDIYKSCGLTAVRIKAINGSAKILELGAIHTLGRTPQPLRYLQGANNSFFGSCNEGELADYRDGVFYEEKPGVALWTDGAIGLEAIPLPETYMNSSPKGRAVEAPIWEPGKTPSVPATDPNDPRYSPDRFMRVAVKDMASHLDFVFVRRTDPQELKSGYEMGWAFSVLPCRRLRPRPIIQSGILHPLSWAVGKHAPKDEVEAAVRKTAAKGADVIAHFLTHNCGGVDGMLMPDNKTTRWGRRASEIGGRYGLIRQMSFILAVGLSESQMRREQLLTADELAKLRTLAGTAEDVDQILCDLNAREYRDYILGGVAIAAKEMGVRRVYFDLSYVFGPLPGNPSSIEGNVRLMEELRLLYDSYDERGLIAWHTGGQVTPTESLADFIFPGEPIAGGGQLFLTPGQNAIPYNAPLTGSTVVPLRLYDSYQSGKPEVWKQFLANVACSFYIDNPIDDPAIWRNIVRYVHPLKIFGIERSEFHSWQDLDISRYVKVDNPACMVNAYVRKGETLLTACLPPVTEGRANLVLNASSLQLTAPQVLLYNTVKDKARVIPVNNGTITIASVDLTKEPAIFYVRELNDPASPLIFWHDLNLEILEQKFSVNPNVPMGEGKLEVKCRFKVAEAKGGTAQFRLYRGEVGNVYSTFFTPFRQLSDDLESRVSVIEVKSPPVEQIGGAVSWIAKGGITFRMPPPGWR